MCNLWIFRVRIIRTSGGKNGKTEWTITASARPLKYRRLLLTNYDFLYPERENKYCTADLRYRRYDFIRNARSRSTINYVVARIMNSRGQTMFLHKQCPPPSPCSDRKILGAIPRHAGLPPPKKKIGHRLHFVSRGEHGRFFKNDGVYATLDERRPEKYTPRPCYFRSSSSRTRSWPVHRPKGRRRRLIRREPFNKGGHLPDDCTANKKTQPPRTHVLAATNARAVEFRRTKKVVTDFAVLGGGRGNGDDPRGRFRSVRTRGENSTAAWFLRFDRFRIVSLLAETRASYQTNDVGAYIKTSVRSTVPVDR